MAGLWHCPRWQFAAALRVSLRLPDCRVGFGFVDLHVFRNPTASHVRRLFLYDDLYPDERIVYPDRQYAQMGVLDNPAQSHHLFYRSNADDCAERKWLYRYPIPFSGDG